MGVAVSSHTDNRDAPDARAIARAGGGQRAVRLRKQHRELVAKVRRKRSALQRLGDEADRVARELAERSAPLRVEQRDLDHELHAAFDAIDSDPRLGRSERRAVRRLYRWLQSIGALSERIDDAPPPVATEEAPPAPAMRPTFLRLATAYHPDKTTDDAERERHTEIMKELNRAYRDGDVSRLLEMERALDGGDDAAALDPVTLEQQVTALRSQLRDLSNQMSDLRSEYAGAVALEHRRLTEAGHQDPVGAMVDELRGAIAETRTLRDLVDQFRAGEIHIDELLAGPAPADDGDDWLTDMFASR